MKANSVYSPISKHDNPYIFALEGSQTLYIQQPVIADFTPVRALDIVDNVHKMMLFSIIPTFNCDGRFYSQGFTNPYEGLQTEQKLMSEHATKLRETSQIPSDDILLPKPRNKDPFCFVCRIQYSDYLEHIDNPTHKKSIAKSRYEKYILQLSGEYKQRRINTNKHDRRCSERLKQRKGQ